VETNSFSQLPLLPDSFSFLGGTGPSHLIRCELSRLCCHGHSLLLSSYLCRIKWKENSSCSACGHPLQDLTHLLLDCPASEPLRRAIFGITSSILTSGPDLGAWPDCWVYVEFLHAPILRKGSGSTTTTTLKLIVISLLMWTRCRIGT